MAVTTRMAAPSYKIYEPDALDAIYAKGSLDPIMGGIAGAMGIAKRQNTIMDQEEFVRQQDRYNKMAANLDAMEIDSKTKQEALKEGVKLIMHGTDASGVKGIENILTPGAIGANDTASLYKTKVLADAAKGSGGGDGGKESWTERWTANGKDYEVKHQGKPGATGAPSSPVVEPKDVTATNQNKNTDSQKAQRILMAVGAKSDKDISFTNDPANPKNIIVTNKANGTVKKFDKATANEAR